MQNHAANKDPAALSVALELLRRDDADGLDQVLLTNGWIRNEVVYADGESPVVDRVAKGWLQSIATVTPVIAVESLVRLNLRGKVGDTLLLIATKNGKTAICGDGNVPNSALADHWSMLATRFDCASAETFDSVGVYEHGYAAQMFCNRMYRLVNRNYGAYDVEECVCCPNAPNAQLTTTLLNAAQRLIDAIYWSTVVDIYSGSPLSDGKRYNALQLDGDFACGRNEPLARFGTQRLKEFQLVSKKKYEDKMGMVESGIPIEDVDRLLKASDYNVDNAMTLWQKERMVMVESGVLIEDVDRLLKASDYNIDNALTLWQKEKEAEIAKKKETDAALAALADPFGRDEVGDGDY